MCGGDQQLAQTKGAIPFEPIEELRQALLEFQRTYNSQWLLQRHGYRTPDRVFADVNEQSLSTAASA